ncbi:hypothetical protein H6F98_18150 [Microcoleus sp. FACHB-SPT15]|nr:hypothetical protein [Microcoleus sp. FACHB-SPT15]MBD1807357.1 hypothetical protein [Microcoleus sp. FACHB-SPT15]
MSTSRGRLLGTVNFTLPPQAFSASTISCDALMGTMRSLSIQLDCA